MKVICNETSAKNLDLSEVTTILSNDFDYSFGGYGLELQKEYIVMGIMQYHDTKHLYYLIDTNGKPDWFPYALFTVSNDSLPANWSFKVYNQKENSFIHFLCGFEELCNSPNFYT